MAGVAVAGVLVAILRLPRVVVEGQSMQPTLEPGERLLVLPLSARAGRLVVLTDPRQPDRLLVKRVVLMAGEGSVAVAGDNPAASTDSRHFGPVPLAQVRGRPIYRYHPPERAGCVWGA